MKRILFCLFLAVLVGCTATPYQKSTVLAFSGGYYEKALPSGEYAVGFAGNGYLSNTNAKDYALLRSAEITIEQGKKYFEIVQDGSTVVSDNGIAKPKPEYIIRLFDEQPQAATGEVYNALETKKLIENRYGI